MAQDKTVLFKKYVHAGIYEKWHKKSLSSFTNSKLAVEKISTYFKKLDTLGLSGLDGRGFILVGKNGVGKSLLLNLSFMHLISKGHKAKVIQFSDLVAYYTSSFGGDERFRELLNKPFLGIDDVGKGFEGSQVSKELVVAAFDKVIRYRTQRLLPTWFTTNLQLAEFKTEYSKSIASLMQEVGDVIKFGGKDYRTDYFVLTEL